MTKNNENTDIYSDFYHSDVSSKEHQSRKTFHIRSGKALSITIKQLLSSNTNYLDSIHQIKLLPKAVLFSTNSAFSKASDFKDVPFGAINTLENAGCLAFIAYNVLLFSGKYSLSVEEITHIITNKGYRMWKFENDSKIMNIPKINLTDLNENFSDKLKSCSSVDDVYKILGKPVGIGGSMFFIDNLVDYFSEVPTIKYQLTRLWSFDEIIANLACEIPVPIRVNNSIYLDDANKKEGHYVLLVGIDNGYAFIVDSSCDKTNGLKVVPLRRFLKSVIHDSELIVAWNVSNLFK